MCTNAHGLLCTRCSCLPLTPVQPSIFLPGCAAVIFYQGVARRGGSHVQVRARVVERRWPHPHLPASADRARVSPPSSYCDCVHHHHHQLHQLGRRRARGRTNLGWAGGAAADQRTGRERFAPCATPGSARVPPLRGNERAPGAPTPAPTGAWTSMCAGTTDAGPYRWWASAWWARSSALAAGDAPAGQRAGSLAARAAGATSNSADSSINWATDGRTGGRLSDRAGRAGGPLGGRAGVTPAPLAATRAR
jgi:hypothetical protein